MSESSTTVEMPVAEAKEPPVFVPLGEIADVKLGKMHLTPHHRECATTGTTAGKT